MRTLLIPGLVFLASAAVACSFQVGGRNNPNTPAANNGTTPATPGATPTPTPTPRAGTPISGVGKNARGNPNLNPSNPSAPTNPTTPTNPGTPGTPPILSGANIFGSGTPDAAGWKGTFFVLPAATQKLPDLATQTPGGVLFASRLDVSQKAMTGGFPGIDASRNENFAIRWEAPLIVDADSDYTFRLVSDDGSKLLIDGTPIVDNDGTRAAAAEKSGPVHLVKGTHAITVDYFQATGTVALQLFCKKAGGTESICPTRL